MKRLIALLSVFVFCASDAHTQEVPAQLVQDNTAFATELYGQLKSQSGNLFFSPESILTALAMTYAGARGATATEMAQTLHFSLPTLPPAQLHAAMGAMLRDRNAAHEGYQLKEADALWGQQGYTFLGDFLKLTKENYGAGLNQVDFKGATESARATINAWVEQQTENKIKDLIQPGVLGDRTRLVLTNAIYFKGDWDEPFKKEQTYDETFHLLTAETVQAPFMYRAGSFNYLDGGDFQALEIPYKKDLSMIVLLPKSVDGLPAFEQSLTAAKLQQWLNGLQLTFDVHLSLPKFKTTAQFMLNDPLEKMGMQQAFDPKQADFSGMASREEMLHDGNLYISAVIHKAYVDVNEEGTEAAAATAVVMASGMAVMKNPTPPHIFCADHPFVFLIRDNHSGGILFMGRVVDPTK